MPKFFPPQRRNKKDFPVPCVKIIVSVTYVFDSEICGPDQTIPFKRNGKSTYLTLPLQVSDPSAWAFEYHGTVYEPAMADHTIAVVSSHASIKVNDWALVTYWKKKRFYAYFGRLRDWDGHTVWVETMKGTRIKHELSDLDAVRKILLFLPDSVLPDCILDEDEWLE